MEVDANRDNWIYVGRNNWTPADIDGRVSFFPLYHNGVSFLAVQSIVTDSLTHSLTEGTFTFDIAE